MAKKLDTENGRVKDADPDNNDEDDDAEGDDE